MHQRCLIAEPFNTLLLLFRQGVAVLRRPAFNNIGNVKILVAAEADGIQHTVQQLAAAADKGLSLHVLLFTGPFPNKEYLCRCV